MMARYKYSVYVVDSETSQDIREVSLTSKNIAIQKAREWAGQYPDKQVFIQFYRDSDGQVGYINYDGADLTGKSWTDPEAAGPLVPAFVGAQYVANLVGTSRQNVSATAKAMLEPGYRGEERRFPRPDGTFEGSPIWLKSRFEGDEK